MSFCPAHGEVRGGDRWDKPSAAWVPADEWQRRQWAREDAAFARHANQGELACPMVIRDGLGLHGLQSQVDGRMYDSKRAMRRHYRESGMIEVGDEPIRGRFWGGGGPRRDADHDRKLEDTIGRALNRAGISLDGDTIGPETVTPKAPA